MTYLRNLALIFSLVLVFGVAMPLPASAAIPTNEQMLRLQIQILELKLKLAALTNPTVATAGKPTCTLVASDEYPGDPGKRVRLRWTSTNAEYATMKYETANAERIRSFRGKFNAEGYKTVGPDLTTTYYLTVHGDEGTGTCQVIVNYKG